jgi:polyhydroxybutyrate depolymerase
MFHRIQRNVSKIVLTGFFLRSIVVGFSRRARVSASAPSDATKQLQYQGRIREYLVHLPIHFLSAQSYPLVLAFHGRLGTSSGMQSLSGFNAVADANQFIVVYPQGVERSWADGRGATPADLQGIDDVGFISTLIDHLSNTLPIRKAQVYATGISNGGLLAQRLACELSDRITAIAVVAATFSSKLVSTCRPVRPVPVLQIMGTQDPYVPFEGGTLSRGAGGELLSHEQAIVTWVRLNGCSTSPLTTHLPDLAQDGTLIEQQVYEFCAAAAQVQSYVIHGGGHTWPGSVQPLSEAPAGKTTRNLQASSIIWEFFSTFTLSSKGGHS